MQSLLCMAHAVLARCMIEITCWDLSGRVSRLLERCCQNMSCGVQHARQYVQYLTEKEQERHDAMVNAEQQLEQFRVQQDDLKRRALEVGTTLGRCMHCNVALLHSLACKFTKACP